MILNFDLFKKDLACFLGKKGRQADIKAISHGLTSHFRGNLIGINKNTFNDSINIQTDNNFYTIEASEIEKAIPQTISAFNHPCYRLKGKGVSLEIQL